MDCLSELPGRGPEQVGACPEPSLTPPRAPPGLPDSEGGVTRELSLPGAPLGTCLASFPILATLALNF